MTGNTLVKLALTLDVPDDARFVNQVQGEAKMLAAEQGAEPPGPGLVAGLVHVVNLAGLDRLQQLVQEFPRMIGEPTMPRPFLMWSVEPPAPMCDCPSDQQLVAGVLHDPLDCKVATAVEMGNADAVVGRVIVGSIERCDQCNRFPGDLHAAQAVRDHLGYGRVMFYVAPPPEVENYELEDLEQREWDGSDETLIADDTSPWVAV